MSTNYGPWVTWIEDHPLEHIEHKGRFVFHNTSGCVSWETDDGERDLWDGPGFEALVSALIEAGEVAPGRVLKLLQGAAMDALKAQLADAKAVLREVESVNVALTESYGCPCCPVCRKPSHLGHAPDCRLAKAIAE